MRPALPGSVSARAWFGDAMLKAICILRSEGAPAAGVVLGGGPADVAGDVSRHVVWLNRSACSMGVAKEDIDCRPGLSGISRQSGHADVPQTLRQVQFLSKVSKMQSTLRQDLYPRPLRSWPSYHVALHLAQSRALMGSSVQPTLLPPRNDVASM